eukprot:389005_1
MQCNCCDALDTEEKLYQCDHEGCRISHKWYCQKCGSIAHQRLNHKFQEIISGDAANNEKQHHHQKDKVSPKPSLSEAPQSDGDVCDDIRNTTNVGLGLFAGISIIGTGAVATCIAIGGFSAAVAITAHSIYSSKKNKKKAAKINQKLEAKYIAMDMYNFDENDIRNANRFNENIIRKRYHRMAKYYHPDKKHGDRATFIRLDVARHILLSMVNPIYHRFPFEDAYKLFCKDENIIGNNMKAIEYFHGWLKKWKEEDFHGWLKNKQICKHKNESLVVV